jgi:hypothetical protein
MEDVWANTATPSRTACDPGEICEGSITVAPTPAEERAPPIIVPPPPPVTTLPPPPVTAPPPPVTAPPPPVPAPPPPVTAPPPSQVIAPPLSDSNQDSRRVNEGPTELEIALAVPDLGPEVRKYLQQKKFQRAKKVEPGNAITARQVCPLLCSWATNVVAGDSVRMIGVLSTPMGPRASSTTTETRSTRNRRRYVQWLFYVYSRSQTYL